MDSNALIPMEIKEVDWGIANNFGDYIEVNRNLKHYPELYYPILKHELSHLDTKFSLKDLKLDMAPDHKLSTFELLKFMITYPKSFTQLLPVYWKRGKGLVIDTNLILMYMMFSALIGLTIYMGVKYL